jgi:hypothetical protein
VVVVVVVMVVVMVVVVVVVVVVCGRGWVHTDWRQHRACNTNLEHERESRSAVQ